MTDQENSPQQLESTTVSHTSESSSVETHLEIERGEWELKFAFVLSCIGMSVGIGNIWRFPYLAYKNGGAVFLIPYTLLMLFIGKPMYFLEVAMGQFCSRSALPMWNCCPIAQGVGFAMHIVNFLASIYYHIIVSYTVFYTAASFASVLPWKDCYEWWGPNKTCFVRKPDSLPTCSSLKINITPGVNCDNSSRQTASEQYWNRYVLHIHESKGFDDIGEIRWDLTLCLLFSWVVVYFCLFKGIKSASRAVYFTITFPYIILLVLVIRGLTLEGADVGLRYLFVPDWTKLFDITVWKDAAEQMFFSLGVGWGILIMFGSYNKFDHKIYRDVCIAIVADYITSIIGSIAVFSVLGHLSKQLHLDISKVATAGPGLAFAVYPEALVHLPISQLWSVLFFLMLFILGLDSEFAQVEGLAANFYDYWPRTRRMKPLVSLILCIIFFLLGLTCVTSGGQYVLHFIDSYGPSHSLLFVAICEMVSLMWIYGVRQVIRDLNFMLNMQLGYFWYFTWALFTPIVLITIYILSFVYYTPLNYGGYYDYPDWALDAGWALEFCSVVQIPLWGMAKLFYYWKKGDLMAAFRPTPQWGPSDPIKREEWFQRIISNPSQQETIAQV